MGICCASEQISKSKNQHTHSKSSILTFSFLIYLDGTTGTIQKGSVNRQKKKTATFGRTPSTSDLAPKTNNDNSNKVKGEAIDLNKK